MLPPMSTGWPNGAQGFGQARMPGPEGAGGAFAMDEQLSPLAVDGVQLDLTGVVRDVVKELQVASWERSDGTRAARSGREFRGWPRRS